MSSPVLYAVILIQTQLFYCAATAFVKKCLQRYWIEKGNRECPVCRRKSSIDKPPVNRALKNIVELYLEQKTHSETDQQKDLCCQLHGQKLLLFCEDDEEALCVVCQTSRKHRNHQLCPAEEVALDLKKNLKTALEPIKQRHQMLTEVKQQCKTTAEHIRAQGHITEIQIKAEFAKLHSFLQNEEAVSLKAIREDMDEKSQALKQKMKNIAKHATILEEKIAAIEKVIESEDILIIKNYKDAQRRAQCPLEDPEFVCQGMLVDVAKHLSNLKFRVWEKMLGAVQYTPVTLDPNTAAPWLCLSEDLTSVKNTGFMLNLPNNVERFNPCVDVLGAEGFTSGRHSWEVEVGDKPEWTIGVVRESINRKGTITCDPASGVFVVTLRAGDVYGAEGATPLALKSKPTKIRVQLDFDSCEVSFFDSADMSHIHTFHFVLGERLFPYFSPCVNINGRQSACVKTTRRFFAGRSAVNTAFLQLPVVRTRDHRRHAFSYSEKFLVVRAPLHSPSVSLKEVAELLAFLDEQKLSVCLPDRLLTPTVPEVMSQSSKVFHVVVEVRSVPESVGNEAKDSEVPGMATPVREEVQMRGSAIPGANRLSEGACTVSSGGFGGGRNFYHSKSPPTSPQRDPRRSPLTIVQQGQPCDGFSQLFSAILNPLDSKESIAQYSPKSPNSPQAWGPRSSRLSSAERGGEGQRSVVSFSYIEKAHVRRVDSPLSARRRTAASFTANSPSLRRSAEGSPLASSTHLRKRLSTPIYLYSPDSSCNSSPALSHRGSGSRQVNSGPCSIVKTTNHLASEELGSPVVKRRAAKGPGDHLRQQSRCQSWAGTSAPVCSAGPSPTTYLGGPSKNHPSSPTTFRPSLATPSTFMVNKSQEVQIPQKQLRVKGGPLSAPLLDKRVNLSQSDSFSSAGRGINQLSGSRTASPIDSPIIARRLTNEFAVTSKDFREAKKLPSPSSQGDHLEPCSPNLGQRGQRGALGSHLAVMNIPVDSVPEANSPVGAERDKPLPTRETESRGRDKESAAPPARQHRFTVYPSIKDPRRQKLCIEDTDSLTLLRHKLPQNMVENWVPSPTHELTTRDSPEPSFRLHVEQGGGVLDTKVPVSLTSHQQWGGAAECSADGPKEGQRAEGSLDSNPPVLLQKELQLRTREARLLGPVVLDYPQSLETQDERQSSPAPEGWSVLPKAEEEQEPGCSSNCGGDRDCISPESTASSHRSFEIGQTTSGIQSDSGLSSMGPSVHSQKMARAKWEFLFGPPSGDNANAGSKDASTTPPSGTSSESPTPTPPNSLPLEGQRSANHDVQHVEVELVTPPPMATGASPKTGIIGRTIKYSETDLDAVPLRCYRETDIDELMADQDDADSAFGSNRSVPGTPGSSPLGGAAYERMDAEEQKQEEEEEQEALGWAGERRPGERKRLHNSQGEGEVFTTLLKRPMDGFFPGHPALKSPILVSGPRLAKEDSFSRHFESIMESHRAKGTSYSSLDSEDLLTSSGQSVYTFDLPTLTPEVQCQTYQSAREIVGLSFAPLARRETPSGSEDTLAALDSDATRAPSSERLSTCSEDTPSWGWYSALSPRERPPQAAVDSDLDRDLSELLGLGSTETLTNGSKADLEAAKRLAKRLFTRDGFRKSDVAKQLSKNNDFSRMVAEEYLHFFNFRCMPLDRALRAFLSEFALMGEAQECKRVLAHFSRRYIYCNPNSSLSEDSACTLTCALMQLNTDLHGRSNGRRMSCVQFIGNLEGRNDKRNFPKELLKVSRKHAWAGEWAGC
ncbi:hypothetical protein GJAV_G00150490 [Gymnothorax javanicus]|nr:hypothetical protein GJAV_G00150490 [Gymnothorax javanicus]